MKRKREDDQEEIVILDETNEGFTIVGQWVLDLNLRTTHKMVFIALKSYSGFSEIRPSINTVARRAGCSRSTAKRSIHVLVKKKLVQVRQGKRPDGGTGANIYVLRNPNKIPRIQNDPRVTSNLSTAQDDPGAESIVNRQYIYNKIETHNNASISLDEILTGVFAKVNRAWIVSQIEKSKRSVASIAQDLDRLCWQYNKINDKVRSPEALIRKAIADGWSIPEGFVPLEERNRRLQNAKADSTAVKAKKQELENIKELQWAEAAELYRKLPESEKDKFIGRYLWMSPPRREEAAIGAYMRERSR